MTIAVPSAGAPILDSWGQAVAAQLNRMQPVQMAADVTTDSASAQSATGLSWTVEAGKFYVARLVCMWSASATNKGIVVGFSDPGGVGSSHLALVQIYGKTTRTSVDLKHTGGGLQGISSCNTADDKTFLMIDYRGECTSDGTVQIQFARDGSSGGAGVTLYAGSGGYVLADS